jgi:hypothetical protein
MKEPVRDDLSDGGPVTSIRTKRPSGPRGGGLSRWALILIAIALGGCSSSTLNIYARPNDPAPTLSGKTVAVVPPITFGGDIVNSLIFDRTTSRVFRDDLGDAHFITPDGVRDFVREVPGAMQALERWSRSAQRRAYFPAEGDAWILHDKKKPLPGGVELDQGVEFQSGGGATPNLLPSRLDPAWFGNLEADYLLVGMSYTKYREESGIYALFGFLPVGGYSYGGPADVRAHFALYERRTGQRLWEAYYGVETRETSPGKWPRYPLDPRTGTVLGAAWTLCHDFQAAALRLLSNDPRSGDDPIH